jgi:hypothetical protein
MQAKYVAAYVLIECMMAQGEAQDRLQPTPMHYVVHAAFPGGILQSGLYSRTQSMDRPQNHEPHACIRLLARVPAAAC